jgi:hypothetical protein
MEDWVKVDRGNFQNEIVELANLFIQLEHLVDETLARFK